MPEAYIIPLPPKWERDLDCGWVEFKSGKDDIRGYFAKPKGKRDLPGIVMIHENLGVIEHRQDVTRRLAKAGYAVLTVDLYSRIGGQSPRDFTTPEERRIKAFRAMPDEQVIPDLEAGCRYLEALPEIDPRAHRYGRLLFGRRAALRLGTGQEHQRQMRRGLLRHHGPASRDAVTSDGKKPLERIRQADKLPCPIQIHQGEADRVIDGVREIGGRRSRKQRSRWNSTAVRRRIALR